MNAELVARAKALAAEGLSHRAIARVLGTTHPTIAKLLKIPGPSAENAAPPDAVRAATERVEPLPEDTLGRLREMQRAYLDRAERFEHAGDFTAAGRAGRDAAVLAPVIARLERDAKASDGAFTYSLANVEAIREGFRRKVADVQHRGLTCCECGRVMRRREAEGDELEERRGGL